MISKASGDGRGALNPTMTQPANREFETQAMMIVTEIVEASDHKDASSQRFGLLCQIAGATSKPGKSLEGSIEI